MKPIATVKDLIDYLEVNFKPTDRLCYFYEGGAWCELVRIRKSQIGKEMFRYAKDKMNSEIEHENDVEVKSVIENNYRGITEDSVVIY